MIRTSLAFCLVALPLAGCAGNPGGVELRSGQTRTQLQADRTACLRFIEAHPEARADLAEAACLIARGYRASVTLTQSPVPIGWLYATAQKDPSVMVADFQACHVEAFNTPMPVIKDKNTSGIFSNFIDLRFPRGIFSKALTSDQWALRSFGTCLTDRGYTVSGVTLAH
jgi:hypothetical protein